MVELWCAACGCKAVRPVSAAFGPCHCGSGHFRNTPKAPADARVACGVVEVDQARLERMRQMHRQRRG